MSKERRSLNLVQPADHQPTKNEIDGPKILARAEALIETLKEDFLIWLTTELEAIQIIQDRWKEDGVDAAISVDGNTL